MTDDGCTHLSAEVIQPLFRAIEDENSECVKILLQEGADVNKRNKKVLLRERKRHTARRVAIAISSYSGGRGGGPLTKNFFPSLNMYQAKSGVKNFSLYCGRGGVP